MRVTIRLRFLVTLILLMIIGLPTNARADSGREFMLSCTYGALAGTLVGAASLAFSDKPGDNLNSIARGASIGLYAGILLGLYVAYGVSNDRDDDSVASYQLRVPPRVQVFPLLTERGFEGAAAQVNVLRF